MNHVANHVSLPVHSPVFSSSHVSGWLRWYYLQLGFGNWLTCQHYSRISVVIDGYLRATGVMVAPTFQWAHLRRVLPLWINTEKPSQTVCVCVWLLQRALELFLLALIDDDELVCLLPPKFSPQRINRMTRFYAVVEVCLWAQCYWKNVINSKV